MFLFFAIAYFWALALLRVAWGKGLSVPVLGFWELDLAKSVNPN
jgi:hypothetical protein